MARRNFSTHLPDSDLLLYLVSASSLASENCNKELGIALKTKINPIPIILEDCDWKKHELGEFQALPDKGKPLNEWEPVSKGWQNVVDGIRKIVDKMQSQTDASSGVPEVELRVELAFQQGNVFMMIGQVDVAIKAYSQAITLNLDNANAYHNRGVAYHAKGDYDRAIQNYTKVIKRNSNYAIAYSNRGDAYRNKGDYDRAIDDCNKAIDLNPDYADAYNNRGAAYGETGDIDRAIKDFNTAIDIAPDHADAYNNLRIAYQERGRS